jgi:hypothetical protein
LYSIIEHLQRLLRWQPEESPAAKLDKLEQLVQAYHLPVAEAVPLLPRCSRCSCQRRSIRR